MGLLRKAAWDNPVEGPVRKFRNMEFFAMNGLIGVYHHPPGGEEEFVVLRPEEWRRRAEANARQAKRMLASMDLTLMIEGRKVMQFAQDMMETYKEAKRQGDPFDPKVQDWLSTHRTKSYVTLSNGRRVKVRWEVDPSPAEKKSHVAGPIDPSAAKLRMRTDV